MDNPFEFKLASAKAVAQMRRINKCAELMKEIINEMPDSKEKEAAIEKLMECVMWADHCAAHSM